MSFERVFCSVQMAGKNFIVEEDLFLLPDGDNKFKRIRNVSGNKKKDFNKILEDNAIWKCVECGVYGIVRLHSSPPLCTCKTLMENSVDFKTFRGINFTKLNFQKKRFKEVINI